MGVFPWNFYRFDGTSHLNTQENNRDTMKPTYRQLEKIVRALEHASDHLFDAFNDLDSEKSTTALKAKSKTNVSIAMTQVREAKEFVKDLGEEESYQDDKSMMEKMSEW
jgi:ABC-type transporter Mla subunit MlaD